MCTTCGCSSKAAACDPKSHESHLCELAGKKTPVAEMKQYVKDSKFICQRCGRTATKDINLCSPEKI